jgi:signal transduction histidine kinase
MMMATEFVPDVEIRQSLKNNILILEKMTASILEEERIDSPYGKINRDSFDLEKMLAEIVEQKKNNGQTVVLSTTESLILCADRERLRIAITNIVDNSLKYSRKDSGPVQIYYTKVDNAVQIRISDSGIGIAEAEIPFIFEPFYRVDKARKQTAGGYGLGLSLTKKIINAHNGTITVDSVISKGTTFTVSLPL